MNGAVYLRFYEELNDFLPDKNRKNRFPFAFDDGMTVGELLARLNVPLDRVEIILADGVSVDLSHRLQEGEYLSIYPVFELLDVSSLVRLRKEPLRRPRFLVARELHGLLRYLRLGGFDALEYAGDDSEDLRRMSDCEGRVILFHKVVPSMPGRITRAWRIRALKPGQQFQELVEALSLHRLVVPSGRSRKKRESQRHPRP